MQIWQSFVIALTMLRLHKLRAFLTMLGVIIGVMSVTIIVMISNGFQYYLEREFAKVGSDTIFLTFEPWRLGQGQSLGDIEGLKTSDIQYIRDRVPDIILAAGFRDAGRQTVKNGDKQAKSVAIRGVDANFIDLNRVKIIKGRNLDYEDSNQRLNVAVISKDVGEELFGTKDPLGKFIEMPGITLEVVGVTDVQEVLGQRNTKVVFLPLMTANEKWLGGEKIDAILMRSKPGTKIEDVMDQVWRLLMARTGNRAVYSLDSSASILKVFNGVLGAAGFLLAGVAALSLLVGGIGIMNIMLVSVTERTREIGLRKAVGAKRRSVLSQFLIEAATLSLVGGLIGMGIAYLMGLGVTALTVARSWPNESGLPLPFPPLAALGALAFSATVGMVFGFYPAFAASRLDPIVALRHE
ncbi:MAG: ABC transporter permease [Armatimonadetes bacterium]|nr:ABC transporter permease [Armatimonadota bacterium]